jgi:predicted ATP-grasp superfamily ATP-dependent carboligase
VLASLTAQRRRQLPRDFGHRSTFVETVRSEPVETAARRLLAAVRYSGLVEVEFKYDRRDDSYKLLDVNLRPWGWHSLGARAGVDFCYLAWLQAWGRPVPARSARVGVRWMREIVDPFAAATELWRGELSPRQYLASFAPPIELAVLAWDDPAPAARELANLFSYGLRVRQLWSRYLG